eukprot:247764_1
MDSLIGRDPSTSTSSRNRSSNTSQRSDSSEIVQKSDVIHTPSDDSIETTITEPPVIYVLKDALSIQSSSSEQITSDIEIERHKSTDDKEECVDLSNPEPLRTEVLSQAEGFFEILGESLLRGVHSRNWNFRLQSALDVQTKLKNKSYGNYTAELFYALCHVIQTLIDDKVYKIFLITTNIIDEVLSQYGKSSMISPNLLCNQFGRVLDVCILKTQDFNKHVRQVSTTMVLKFSGQHKFGVDKVVSRLLHDPKQPSNRSWRLLVSRLQLLRQLVSMYGVSSRESDRTSTSLCVESLMTFSSQCLTHRHDLVRHAAIALCQEIYSQVGPKINSYITDLSPFMLKTLRSGFADVDGSDIADNSSYGIQSKNGSDRAPETNRSKIASSVRSTEPGNVSDIAAVKQYVKVGNPSEIPVISEGNQDSPNANTEATSISDSRGEDLSHTDDSININKSRWSKTKWKDR